MVRNPDQVEGSQGCGRTLLGSPLEDKRTPPGTRGRPWLREIEAVMAVAGVGLLGVDAAAAAAADEG